MVVLLPPARDPVSDPMVEEATWRLPMLGINRPVLQILLTAVAATIIAWAGRSWPPGLWNLIPPVVIALLANKGFARLVFALVLIGIFVATLIANEVAAHLLFGTCLYD